MDFINLMNLIRLMNLSDSNFDRTGKKIDRSGQNLDQTCQNIDWMVNFFSAETVFASWLRGSTI